MTRRYTHATDAGLRRSYFYAIAGDWINTLIRPATGYYGQENVIGPTIGCLMGVRQIEFDLNTCEILYHF
jgi:hypothetical protein